MFIHTSKITLFLCLLLIMIKDVSDTSAIRGAIFENTGNLTIDSTAFDGYNDGWYYIELLRYTIHTLHLSNGKKVFLILKSSEIKSIYLKRV